jgi:hypothetical protein
MKFISLVASIITDYVLEFFTSQKGRDYVLNLLDEITEYITGLVEAFVDKITKMLLNGSTNTSAKNSFSSYC